MKKICFLFLVSIALLGCVVFPAAATPTPSLIPTVDTPSTLPEPTDRTQVQTVEAGQPFDVVLPSNPSTGYRWQIVGTLDASLLESLNQSYLAEQPVIPGSGGVEVWTFRAPAPGETEIQFGYFPPGNTTQADETAIFSIRIE